MLTWRYWSWMDGQNMDSDIWTTGIVVPVLCSIISNWCFSQAHKYFTRSMSLSVLIYVRKVSWDLFTALTSLILEKVTGFPHMLFTGSTIPSCMLRRDLGTYCAHLSMLQLESLLLFPLLLFFLLHHMIHLSCYVTCWRPLTYLSISTSLCCSINKV